MSSIIGKRFKILRKTTRNPWRNDLKSLAKCIKSHRRTKGLKNPNSAENQDKDLTQIHGDSYSETQTPISFRINTNKQPHQENCVLTVYFSPLIYAVSLDPFVHFLSKMPR